MGLFKLGNGRPGFRRDRHERLPVPASAVILIDNQIFIRRPAAATRSRTWFSRTSLIWAATRCRSISRRSPGR